MDWGNTSSKEDDVEDLRLDNFEKGHNCLVWLSRQEVLIMWFLIDQETLMLWDDQS